MLRGSTDSKQMIHKGFEASRSRVSKASIISFQSALDTMQ